VDPLQPVYQMESLDDVIAQSVAARRFQTSLVDLFAALGLTLCSVGVYGTINHWVGERAREIGVRMALGASRRGIARMVVGRALALTAIGIAIGLVLCASMARALSTFLFAVQPFDPGTLALVTLVVLGIGGAAAYLPARRAARLDPLAVIRNE
jgi:putative ABC transport system permease protein